MLKKLKTGQNFTRESDPLWGGARGRFLQLLNKRWLGDLGEAEVCDGICYGIDTLLVAGHVLRA